MLLQYILQSIWSFVIWYIMPGLSAVNVLQSPSGQISDCLCFVRPSPISRQIILVPEWRHCFPTFEFDVLIWWASLLLQQVTCTLVIYLKIYRNVLSTKKSTCRKPFYWTPPKKCASDVHTLHTKAVMPKEHVHRPVKIFHITLFSATNVQHVR